MLPFYLALYDIGDPTAYHWALFATEHGHDPASTPVQMFQIVTHRGDHHEFAEDGYIASHTARNLLSDPASSERLLCVVPLPGLNMTMPELQASIQAQPVGRRDTPLFATPWGRWGCSQWAIRVIRELVEEGVVVTHSSNSFFTRAAAGRSVWGPMLHLAGTKCAHNAMAGRNAGDGVTGIRMASFEPHGIKL